MKKEQVTTDNPIADDRTLRDLLSSLPQAEMSPWFTRRVLNRLPDRRRRIAGVIEYGVYIVALLWLLFTGVSYLAGNISNGITVGDMLNYIAWLSVVGGLIYAIMEPRISASAVRRRSGRGGR